LSLNPADPKSLKPEGRLNLHEEELQAIKAAKTLLEVTKNLKLNLDKLNSPEYSQRILLRGELIQALEHLPLATYSDSTRSCVLELLNQLQACNPEVEEALKEHKNHIFESMQSLKAAKKVQNGYYTALEAPTRNFEG
jgi:hypothetical protein